MLAQIRLFNKWRLYFRSRANAAHINLAGDGNGDQRGAAFLQQVDGALGFGGEGELISRFEQKIQATLARIWGEATPSAPEA